MRPIVALVTDFGNQDHYVGAVKGAVLAACPEATLVDIVHDLPPHDVVAGAFALMAAYRAFPGGAVFLAVVDPGVGSARRGLAIEAGGYRFVGPDNGIFTYVFADHPQAQVRAVVNSGLFRHQVSPTFQARDVFGPVAGHLARGAPLEEVGPVLQGPVIFAQQGVRTNGAREWEASVVHVDRFGNLTTNLSERDLGLVLDTVGGDASEILVTVAGAVLPLVRTYADVPEGESCALVGSSGRLEIASYCGSAARLLQAGKGTPVFVRVVPVQDEGV